ncbi:3'(2'),5'-bisphosphate nucleotidase CysQ [Thalassomonas viridans]|uniref:3'(2'),5'-bisphosphate nucleotidase CysQ n=1 Tax=Thalassomonas viridans TaxID=137584 RepID=A0AAE9ZAU8_9GAMM|nr:3'(2'),5'-bisphosphate nucleotidase CysQ [Thalassomonas viridans]WDE09247.1 3'(2'),5'-bisphosphate nucleotidase CysQ [Thalassomonas viridans]
MIDSVIRVAQQAAQAILEVYHRGDFTVGQKADASPVTRADLAANDIIIAGLAGIGGYPVLTEESPVAYAQRRHWQKYWLVDPLDGTKDFIAKNDGFTVNIALMENRQPVLGVVLLPVTGDVYYAEKNSGAFKNGRRIINRSQRRDLIASDSIFHSTPLVSEFFAAHKITRITRFGSSIKICKLAEGVIDVYPRLNGTKEWDTAASHIIANEAGCKLIDVVTAKPLTYNKENLVNNHFIASRNDLHFVRAPL